MKNPKTIFITGLAGFFGKYLSLLYLQNGYRVVGYDTQHPNFNHHNLIFVNGDLLETDKMLNCLKQYKPNYFIHLAGLIKSKSIRVLFEVNVYGFQSVCEAISLSDLKPHVALIGSSAVYDESCDKISESHSLLPITAYGLTKKIQEDIVINYSKRGFLTYTIFRLFNLIGYGMPQELAIASFVKRIQIAKQQGARSIDVGNLSSIRDYIDVRDAADIVFKLFNGNNLGFDVINICSGVGYQIADILELCCDILDFNPDIHVQDNFIQNYDVKYQVGSADKLSQYYDMSSLYSIRSSILTMIAPQSN